MYYLFLDTETGGLTENTSLLTLGTIVTNKDFNIIEEIEWKIKPDDGIYKVTGQALQINKINLANHNKYATPYKQAKTELYEYLKEWSQRCKFLTGNNQLIPVGKNIYFDLIRIWDNLISRQTWETFVSYQPFEINGAWRLLEAQGKVPILPKTSLIDIANYFNISIPCTWLHTSIGDCRIYIEIMKRLVQL